MGDKVTKGDSFSKILAPDWNRMLDASEDYARRRALSPIQDTGRDAEISTNCGQVKNTCGADRRQGEILEVDDNALSEVDEWHLWVTGIEPTGDLTKGFGILRKALPNDDIGPFQVSGFCKALVNVTDTNHMRAAPASGSYVLESGESGPIQLLYAATGTGEQECMVVFSGSESIRLFETTEKLTLGGKCKARQLRRIGTSKEFETFGDEFYVNDFRRDFTHYWGQYIAGPGYRGVCCLPTPATITSMSILSILSLSTPFSMSASPIENEWQIVDLEYVAQSIEFILTEDMDAVAGVSENATVVDFYDGKDPGSVQHIHDPRGLFKRALIGAKGWAVRIPWGLGDPAGDDWPEGRYVAVECQSLAGTIYFTLDADRSDAAPTEELDITIDYWTGTQQDIQEPTESSPKVNFREGYFPVAKEGNLGIATLDSEDGKYWATFIHEQHEYLGVTDEDIEADSSGMVNIWANDVDTGVQIESHLKWMHGGEDVEENTQVAIRWFQDWGKWMIIQAACAAEST